MTPVAASYDDHRRVWNAVHDRRPALIARCVSAVEVSSVLRYARSAGLAVTVRGGGHNVAGKAVSDDSVMIDLSLMRDVSVDPSARLARAQGGCLLRDLDAATTPHGLACPAGVVSHTGLGGLALGGGYGWLARRWGLTCDHILAAEVVLADGSIVEASDSAHSELLWALRGGGGNFGIVTRFTLSLRPIGPVVHRTGIYPLDDAAGALAAYREFAEGQPADLHAVGAFKIASDQDWIPAQLRGRPALQLTAAWFGDRRGGERAVGPLFDECAPAGGLERVLSFAELQALGDHSEPHGRRYFTKSCYLGELGPATADAMIGNAEEIRSPLSCVDFEYLRGAITDVPDEESAFPARGAPYMYTASAHWIDPNDDDEEAAWSRRSIARLAEWHYGGSYVNYVQDEPALGSVDVYGAGRYRRLAAVKRRYDPDNLLRHNQNIAPAPETRTMIEEDGL
ncbi:FAD-binding oxidoreductase [Micromonospora orduensis]|uniref:FAD-binding oxidoreductase n=1 Tax=Micromonospora orduensis TaxID=1420891 RepID=A0A5C4QH93_9ACTN|nr:FAD-binding oxidoreductase [Micromonospora orduensis]TNH23992.1 FAD-binding oxidoreductase [Micromonospora orduensis]